MIEKTVKELLAQKQSIEVEAKCLMINHPTAGLALLKHSLELSRHISEVLISLSKSETGDKNERN